MTPHFARNNGPDASGQVTFTDATQASGMAGVELVMIVFGDVDNDGDADAFVGQGSRTTSGTPAIWLNDGTGTFTSNGNSGLAPHLEGPSSGGNVYREQLAATFADFDRDGNLDLYVGTWYGGLDVGGSVLPTEDELYRGNGDGTFARVPLPDQHNPLTSQVAPHYANAARAAYGVAAGDYDNDGDLDLFVNNYGAGRPVGGSPPSYWDHNLLWRNDSSEPGNIVFVDVGAEVGVAATLRGIGGVEQEAPLTMNGTSYPSPIGGNGFGCQFGDIDNDGDLDLVVGSIAHPDYSQSDRTMLHVNQGGSQPVFSEESAARGLQYAEDELHPIFVDVNNDGLLDLAMSRLRDSNWELYFQLDGDFHRQAYAGTGVEISRPSSSQWLDVDHDGDLDFFMAKGAGRLFVNRLGQDNGWLAVDLVATQPRDATGARVTVRTAQGTQVREVTAGGGHVNTQQTHTVHFGLAGDSGAEDVTVRWPNGEVLRLGDVRANLRLRVTQGQGVEVR